MWYVEDYIGLLHSEHKVRSSSVGYRVWKSPSLFHRNFEQNLHLQSNALWSPLGHSIDSRGQVVCGIKKTSLFVKQFCWLFEKLSLEFLRWGMEVVTGSRHCWRYVHRSGRLSYLWFWCDKQGQLQWMCLRFPVISGGIFGWGSCLNSWVWQGWYLDWHIYSRMVFEECSGFVLKSRK